MNGFASSGTLYPPLNRTLREPLGPLTRHTDQLAVLYVLEVQATTTLPDARGPEAGAGAVRGAGVEGRADEGDVVLDVVAGEAGVVVDAAEGRDAGEDGVGLAAVLAGWSSMLYRGLRERYT